MNRFFILAASILFLICITACTPIGGVGDGGGSDGVFDTFWIVPKCWEYEAKKDLFLRDSDLAVFGSFEGTVVKIAIDAVDIGIIENLQKPDEITQIPSGEDYPFITAGRKVIVVNYGTMSDRYTIQVKDSEGVTNPGGNGGGTGIIIEWEDWN